MLNESLEFHKRDFTSDFTNCWTKYYTTFLQWSEFEFFIYSHFGRLDFLTIISMLTAVKHLVALRMKQLCYYRDERLPRMLQSTAFGVELEASKAVLRKKGEKTKASSRFTQWYKIQKLIFVVFSILSLESIRKFEIWTYLSSKSVIDFDVWIFNILNLWTILSDLYHCAF